MIITLAQSAGQRGSSSREGAGPDTTVGHRRSVPAERIYAQKYLSLVHVEQCFEQLMRRSNWDHDGPGMSMTSCSTRQLGGTPGR